MRCEDRSRRPFGRTRARPCPICHAGVARFLPGVFGCPWRRDAAGRYWWRLAIHFPAFDRPDPTTRASDVAFTCWRGTAWFTGLAAALVGDDVMLFTGPPPSPSRSHELGVLSRARQGRPR